MSELITGSEHLVARTFDFDPFLLLRHSLTRCYGTHSLLRCYDRRLTDRFDATQPLRADLDTNQGGRIEIESSQNGFKILVEEV